MELFGDTPLDEVEDDISSLQNLQIGSFYSVIDNSEFGFKIIKLAKVDSISISGFSVELMDKNKESEYYQIQMKNTVSSDSKSDVFQILDVSPQGIRKSDIEDLLVFLSN